MTKTYCDKCMEEIPFGYESTLEIRGNGNLEFIDRRIPKESTCSWSSSNEQIDYVRAQLCAVCATYFANIFMGNHIKPSK